MKGFPKIVYAAVSTVTLFAALSTSQIQQESNQGQKPDPPPTQQGRAKTIPNPDSDLVITLKITFDNGETMLVSQRDGGLIRIERNNSILGFTPYLPKGSNGPVELRTYEIKPVTKSGKFVGEKMVELTNFDVSNNSLDYKIDDLSSTIQLAAVQKNPRAIQNGNLKDIDYGGINSTECCVTCNGVRACACRVDASCGSCCVSDCC